MTGSLEFLITGTIFGLAAGISPGPLLTLVIAETIRHGRRAGILVALAPLLTDVPIVVVSILILSNLSHSNIILGAISLLGALFVGYLAYESITVKGIASNEDKIQPQSLRKGVIANFLNPHPYLFWIAVGAPTVFKAYRADFFSAALFIIGFYLSLVGSKILVAVMVHKSKDFPKSNFYVYSIRLLGVVLLLFAVLFVRDGIKLLGFI
ncbi:MAG: LysE family translocator [Nitrospirota bacterium]